MIRFIKPKRFFYLVCITFILSTSILPSAFSADKTVKIKPFFNQRENLALRGLYLISKDLFYSDKSSKEFLAVLEPEAEKLSKIRNHLEHKFISIKAFDIAHFETCLLYTSPSPRDRTRSRMPSSA